MGTSIQKDDIIYPYFVVSGKKRRQPVRGFPGISRFSADELVRDVAKTARLGIGTILLFGIPDKKDAFASAALDSYGIVITTQKYFEILIFCLNGTICGIVEPPILRKLYIISLHLSFSLKMLPSYF